MPPLNNFQKTVIAVAVAQSVANVSDAATITVTSTADTTGANLNTCTLRDAIVSANNDAVVIGSGCSAGSGGDEISLGVGTITLVSDLPTITSNLTVGGAGATSIIDGGKNYNIFRASLDVSLNLNSLNLRNGRTAIFLARNSSVALSQSRITNFTGSSSAINLSANSSLVISESTISQNSASAGGVIYAYGEGSSVSISGSQISNNSAYRGGAINILDNTSVLISNSNISTSSASVGGAIFAGPLSTISITAGSRLQNNTVSNKGGAIYSRGSNVSVMNSSIISSYAENDGGAVYASGGDITLDAATFGFSEAGKNGGSIMTSSANLTISDSVISASEAKLNGAALHITGDSDIKIRDAEISNTSLGELGGALSISGDSRVSINNSFIRYNKAIVGGAIAARDNSVVEITNSTFSGNEAVNSSSGISTGGVIDAANSSTVSITNSTLSANTADNYGGAVFATDSSSVTIANSTVTDNSAPSGGGALATSGNTSVSLSSSLFSGNYASAGRELLNFNGTISSSYNLFGDSSLSTSAALFRFTPSNTDILLTSDEGNVPLAQIIEPLADNGGLTQTHALPAMSPAVNAGSGSMCPTADQRGIPRSDGQCDIGAFEIKEESNLIVIPLPNGKTVVVPL